jgi:hypothetical protein
MLRISQRQIISMKNLQENSDKTLTSSIRQANPWTKQEF